MRTKDNRCRTELTQCKTCGHSVSHTATMCPQCGESTPGDKYAVLPPPGRRRFATVCAMAGILLLIMIGFFAKRSADKDVDRIISEAKERVSRIR
ncbi:MAG: hypothetical protein DRJ03_29125 [Chloroflexi bacterium]|nr:MAG: hypothetical protein DRJ03_29125 [Chloroflexota bacterium]